MAVQFHEDSFSNAKQTTKPRSITGFLVKRGFAKTEDQANKMLIVIMVVCAVAAFIVYPRNQSGEELESYEIERAGHPSEIENS